MTLETGIILGFAAVSFFAVYLGNSLKAEEGAGFTSAGNLWRIMFYTVSLFSSIGMFGTATSLSASQNLGVSGITTAFMYLFIVVTTFLWIPYLMLMLIEDYTTLAVKQKARNVLNHR